MLGGKHKDSHDRQRSRRGQRKHQPSQHGGYAEFSWQAGYAEFCYQCRRASLPFAPNPPVIGNGQVRKVGAVCAETGKELVAGDEFVSLLRFGDEGIERTDLCDRSLARLGSTATTSPTGARTWRLLTVANRAPSISTSSPSSSARLQAEGEPVEQREVAYIVTLLLVRRKILTIIRTEDEEGEQEFMILRFTKSEEDEEFRVSVPELSEEKMEAIRDDLSRIFNI